VSSANLPHPAGSGCYEELAVIVNDPAMRRHARLLIGGLAEDLLQETWYAVARACARGHISNLRGYFYRVMVNTANSMREEIVRQGILVDDPAAASGPRRGPDLAAASAESEALSRLLAAARSELLHRRRAELRQEIPACSTDPDRYGDLILAVAEAIVVGDGPANRAEINAALVAAYPEWFDERDATVATNYQRRCRARADIRRVLSTVIGLDSF
jgi:Sigma-70 region 2